jgi:acetolactate synthase-1/2/3 large subunit
VRLIAAAANPLMIIQRQLRPEHGDLLADFAERFAIPVVDFWATSNVMSSDHPMFVGGDPAVALAEADVVIAVETLVPWLISEKTARWSGKVVGIGPDPQFSRTPMRSFPVDVALAGDSGLALAALSEGLGTVENSLRKAVAARRATIARRRLEDRAAARARAMERSGTPMSPAWVSLCLSEAMGPDAAVFNELGCDPTVMNFAAAGTLFSVGLAGGLGWGLPAALGFQLADRERLVIACVGDGSYIFANPVACHLFANAQKLPVLTVVFNNGIWNAVRRATLAMYPDGEAARSNAMPFTQLTPAPDYAAIARAHGHRGERIEDGAALPEAIERAVASIRNDRIPALLEVVVSA